MASVSTIPRTWTLSNCGGCVTGCGGSEEVQAAAHCHWPFVS
jgi:hypothetical protein